MKKAIVITAMLVEGVLAASAQPAAPRWVPGTPYFISERQASIWLRGFNDAAHCTGIPSFGKHGETYVRFDCTARTGGDTCRLRLRSRKDDVHGRFYLWSVRAALTCS